MEHRRDHIEQTCSVLERLWYKLRNIEWIRTRKLEHQLTDSHVLVLPKHGAGYVTIDYNDYRLRYGAVHVASPGQTIGVWSELPEEEIECYVLSFHVRSDVEGQEDRFPLSGEVMIHSGPHALDMCKIIHDSFSSEQAAERLRGQSGFQELICWIANHIRILPETDSRLALEQTKEYIDEHYREGLTIDRLARMAHVSPKYYVDLFTKTYGRSAMDYITHVRISHAKRLMGQSDLRLRDIAGQVGYSDEFYFSRKFKKEVGMSPSAYMKSRQRKIAVCAPFMLGHLLALDLIPYAAPLHPKWTAYYYRKYRDEIPVHLSAYRFNLDWRSNLEVLTQAQPDIVICDRDHLHPDEKAQLERTASVLSVSYKQGDWREQFALIADYLGAERRAKAWLARYERKLELARERLHRELRHEKLLVASIHKHNMYLYPTRGMTELLFDDLRLRPACLPAEGVRFRQLTSLEQLERLSADRILLNVCQETESLDYWKSVQSSSQWSDLKAVRTNKVSLISSDPWREYSPSACDRMLDDLLGKLTNGR